jgi:hypothetical protein
VEQPKVVEKPRFPDLVTVTSKGAQRPQGICIDAPVRLEIGRVPTRVDRHAVNLGMRSITPVEER